MRQMRTLTSWAAQHERKFRPPHRLRLAMSARPPTRSLLANRASTLLICTTACTTRHPEVRTELPNLDAHDPRPHREEYKPSAQQVGTDRMRNTRGSVWQIVRTAMKRSTRLITGYLRLRNSVCKVNYSFCPIAHQLLGTRRYWQFWKLRRINRA